MRSRRQDKGKLECMCSLHRCSNPLDRQANIVKRTVLFASRILDRASNESCLGRKPDRFRYDFRRVAKTLFQIRRDGKSVPSTIKRACASASSRVSRHPFDQRRRRRMVLSSQNCSRSIRLCRLYQSASGHQRPFSGSGWHNPEVGIVEIAHRA